MANTREIQSRMKSIQDTMKITNAMYMISSSKLKKAKDKLAQTEPYFYNLQWAIARIMRHIPDVQSPYFIDDHLDIPPEKERAGYIVVTADKGLAGSYNHNVIKLVEQRLQRPGEKTFFIVGELGRQYFNHAGIPIEEQFHYTVQNPTLGRTRTIAERVMEYYTQGKLDRVYIIYTKMVNSMSSQPEVIRLLPLRKADYLPKVMDLKGTPGELVEMLPSPEELLDHIIKKHRGRIYLQRPGGKLCQRAKRPNIGHAVRYRQRQGHAQRAVHCAQPGAAGRHYPGDHGDYQRCKGTKEQEVRGGFLTAVRIGYGNER